VFDFIDQRGVVFLARLLATGLAFAFTLGVAFAFGLLVFSLAFLFIGFLFRFAFFFGLGLLSGFVLVHPIQQGAFAFHYLAFLGVPGHVGLQGVDGGNSHVGPGNVALGAGQAFVQPDFLGQGRSGLLPVVVVDAFTQAQGPQEHGEGFGVGQVVLGTEGVVGVALDDAHFNRLVDVAPSPVADGLAIFKGGLLLGHGGGSFGLTQGADDHGG